MMWTCLPFIRSGQDHLARRSERGKKIKQTEKDRLTETERERYYASHTKTALSTRKSVPRPSRQSDHMKTS